MRLLNMRGFHAIRREDRAREPAGTGITDRQLKLVLALGEEQLPGAVVVRLGHEDLRGPAQIAVLGRGGIDERLRGGDAVLFEHDHQQLGFDDRPGEEQFHAASVTRITQIFTK